MHLPRRLTIVPVVLALAVAGAGCASAEDAEFVDDYNAAVAPLTTTMNRLSGSIAGDPATASKAMDKVADRLADVRKGLAALDPPADAADELDRMLVLLGKSTKQVRALARATKDGNLKRVGRATTDLTATAGDLLETEEQLRAVVES